MSSDHMAAESHGLSRGRHMQPRVQALQLGDYVEKIKDYGLGGHHPVILGDVLDGRFKVVHKLGYGGFALVWLCWDLRDENERWKAVKIIRADQSFENGKDVQILRMLEQRRSTRGEIGDVHISWPKGTFWIEGPNGQHLCVIASLLGPSIQRNRLGDVAQLKTIFWQVAKGLRFLHHNGICHGDLRPDNILFRLTDSVQHFSIKKMTEILGRPVIEEMRTAAQLPVHPGPRYPLYVIRTADLHRLGIIDEVSIVDFGVAFPISAQPHQYSIPHMYRAPEAAYHCHSGYSMDVWSFALSIIELRTGYPLFEVSDRHRVTLELECYLGPIPEPYRQVWLRDHKQEERIPLWLHNLLDDHPNQTVMEYYDADGYKNRQKWLHHVCGKAGTDIPLLAKIGEPTEIRDFPLDADGIIDYHAGRQNIIINKIPEEELRVLGHLLTNIIRWKPEKRLNIKEIMSHPWFEGRRLFRAGSIHSNLLPLLVTQLSVDLLPAAVAIVHTARGSTTVAHPHVAHPYVVHLPVPHLPVPGLPAPSLPDLYLPVVRRPVKPLPIARVGHSVPKPLMVAKDQPRGPITLPHGPVAAPRLSYVQSCKNLRLIKAEGLM
ncbi:kinase-like domain-containing protein [Xylariales sp. AK1849]|nr:kinase-like domain-containing protein [Xylariales sp. AK1849]